jgi:hypothetical protein
VFEKAPKRKKCFFEENNYIIEPRQMAKYFPLNVDALINEKVFYRGNALKRTHK